MAKNAKTKSAKKEESNSVGRPLKFRNVTELQKKIDAYFQYCAEENVPYTITGLALALNTCRQTLLNYQENDEFLDTIKNAKLRVENFYEKRLIEAHATGSIFALKNFGWKDTQDVTQTNVNPQVVVTKNYNAPK